MAKQDGDIKVIKEWRPEMKKQKNNAARALAKALPFFLCIFLFTVTKAMAIDFSNEISAEDKATFDQILEPVMKVYDLVKYTATAIAVIVLLFAGISYMVSGYDPKKRDESKHMAGYVVIGLCIIWAAPLVVNFVT